LRSSRLTRARTTMRQTVHPLEPTGCRRCQAGNRHNSKIADRGDPCSGGGLTEGSCRNDQQQLKITQRERHDMAPIEERTAEITENSAAPSFGLSRIPYLPDRGDPVGLLASARAAFNKTHDPVVDGTGRKYLDTGVCERAVRDRNSNAVATCTGPDGWFAHKEILKSAPL
jgi:hypothetical protein